MYRQFVGFLPKGRPITVLDLGANGGGFGLMLLQEGFAIERVVAVEMNPATFQRLQFNLARNCHGHVQCINAAVSGIRREYRLPLGRGSTSDNIYSGSETNAVATATVQGIPIDKIISENLEGCATIDVCKIDIEGAEYEVLTEHCSLLARKIRCLIIELHDRPGHRRQDLLDALISAGFVLNNAPPDWEAVYCFSGGIQE